MGMAAVLRLNRPAFSTLVFGAAFVVFWAVLRGSTADTTLLASLQIQAIAGVPASFGVTGLDAQQRASMDTLYVAADQTLCVAKKQGRDRVGWEQPLMTAESPASFSALRAGGTGVAKGQG